MPDVNKTNLRQWCVVWPKADNKTKSGHARVSSPVNVRCRWLISDSAGVSQDVTEEAYPRSVPVDRWIDQGSYVWGPGKIADLPSVPQYYEVVGIQKIVDLKGRHPVYRVSLQKASKVLPEIVS